MSDEYCSHGYEASYCNIHLRKRVAELEAQCHEHVAAWKQMNDRRAELEAVLKRIASCNSVVTGDVVDIARNALTGKRGDDLSAPMKPAPPLMAELNDACRAVDSWPQCDKELRDLSIRAENYFAALATAAERDLDGKINNCALACGDVASNCQMCNGSCPDAPAQPATPKEHCPRRLMGETLAPHAPCDTGDHSKDAAPAQPAMSKSMAKRIAIMSEDAQPEAVAKPKCDKCGMDYIPGPRCPWCHNATAGLSSAGAAPPSPAANEATTWQCPECASENMTCECEGDAHIAEDRPSSPSNRCVEALCQDCRWSGEFPPRVISSNHKECHLCGGRSWAHECEVGLLVDGVRKIVAHWKSRCSDDEIGDLGQLVMERLAALDAAREGK